MTAVEWGLIGAVVALLIVWLALRRRRSAAAPLEERLDTIAGWPPTATRVLNSPERSAFEVLSRAMPEYMVLAQVPMSRFLSVPKRNSYADWMRRLGYQCVDFAVCDRSAQVIAVVELEPPGGLGSERARKRRKRMSRALQVAAIPLQVWTEGALPSIDVVRAALLPRPSPQGSRGAPAAEPDPFFAPTNPFAESHPGHDVTIEVIEPAPSTWFDEFDSEAGALRKH